MATAKVAIGKNYYTIPCTPESKDRVEILAKKMNTMVNKLALQIRGMDDQTLLIVTSLSILDELDDLSSRMEVLKIKDDSDLEKVDKNSDINQDQSIYTKNQMEENIVNIIKLLDSKLRSVLNINEINISNNDTQN